MIKLTYSTLLVALCFCIGLLPISLSGAIDSTINLNTQGQIDSFNINYGGSTIGANIKIDGSGFGESIQSLDSLFAVDSILGGLTIRYTGLLKNLNGLEGLLYIGGEFEVEENDSLISLQGLENLCLVYGNLSILDNVRLTDISSLKEDIILGGQLSIKDNTSLAVCAENWVCRQIQCFIEYEIQGNAPGCRDEGEGVLNCSCVLGEEMPPYQIVIYHQEFADSIASYFERCPFEVLSLQIGGTTVDLDSLYVITEIQMEFSVLLTDSIKDFSGLQNLERVGFVQILYCDSLVDVSAFDSNLIVTNNLEISNNSNLNTCDIPWICKNMYRLPKEEIEINNNGIDCTYEEIFPHCPCVTEMAFVDYVLSSQSDIDSFPFVYNNCPAPIRNVLIKDNPCTNLDSLYVIEGVVGDLIIDNCDFLKNFNGLQKLKYIGTNFFINQNDSLENFMGLDSLVNVGYEFRVTDNPQLTSVALADTNFTLNVYLQLDNNPQLSYCNEDWICNFLASPISNSDFSNNALGCESGIEVVDSCGCIYKVGLQEITFTTQSQLDNFPAYYNNCPIDIRQINITSTDITNLDSLYFIDTILFNLSIINNDRLKDLSGLQNLDYVPALTIGGNDSITDISALKNTIYVEDLQLNDNNLLNACEAEWICDLFERRGSYYIRDNGPDCGSIFSIIKNCVCNVGISGANLEIQMQSEADSVGKLLRTCSFNVYDVIIDPLIDDYICNLDSLVYLDSVFGNFYIEGEDSLNDISGLNQLEYVGGELVLLGCHIIDTMNGFAGLNYIGGDFVLVDNQMLQDISNVKASVQISEYVVLLDNSSLSVCNVPWICNWMTTGNGKIELNGNASTCNDILSLLQSCGCPSNATVRIDVSLSSQTEVDNFRSEYLSCPFKIDNLRISEAGDDDDDDDDDDDGGYVDPITNLDSLSFVDSVFNDLEIRFTRKLNSLSGLDNVKYIGDYLEVEDNMKLQNLQGLGGVRYVEDDLEIKDNSSLTSLSGLSSLEIANGHLEIERNPKLENLKGLSSLKYIGDDLEVIENARLKSLTGLTGLISISDNLEVDGNYMLTSLNGLENLSWCGGNVQLFNNTYLSNISALSLIQAIDDELIVIQNPNLSLCNIGWICDHLSQNKPHIIFGNKPNCHTAYFISQSCNCPDSLTLMNADGLYRAQNQIETNGTQMMMEYGVYDAPNVLLQPGFEVPKGTSLWILQSGCE